MTRDSTGRTPTQRDRGLSVALLNVGQPSVIWLYSTTFIFQAMCAGWKKLRVQGAPRVYVMRNSFLDSNYQGVDRSMLPIASRSIDSLIRTQGVGDIFQIYALCKRDGNDFNLAYIPSSFTEKPTEGFDPVYMTKLYNLGYEMALKGYPWEKGSLVSSIPQKPR